MAGRWWTVFRCLLVAGQVKPRNLFNGWVNYCKFRNLLESFIFTNGVKMWKNWQLVHQKMVELLFLRKFHFSGNFANKFRENKSLAKVSKFTVSCDMLDSLRPTQQFFQPWKSYAHQRETTGLSSDSLQLCPFSKWKLLLNKEFAPSGSEFFPLRTIQVGMKKSLLPMLLGDLPWMWLFQYARV